MTKQYEPLPKVLWHVVDEDEELRERLRLRARRSNTYMAMYRAGKTKECVKWLTKELQRVIATMILLSASNKAQDKKKG